MLVVVIYTILITATIRDVPRAKLRSLTHATQRLADSSSQEYAIADKSLPVERLSLFTSNGRTISSVK